MPRGLNKVTLIGHLGKDPELRITTNNTPVATFSMATNESYKDSEGKLIEKTEWHNIVLWRKVAEIAQQYLKKGSKIYLEGKIATRSYEKDGQKKYITEIVGDTLLMLDGKSDNGGNGGGETQNPPSDLPF
ncbi:MAG: single-stranded DNA-binding protein [Ignavibacteria bacterium]|nr:single-stranded DNA-binding protein [Ignavibacteria bacterium]